MDPLLTDQIINLDMLKQKIDEKLDNIYRLLMVERPRFHFYDYMHERH